MRDVRRESPRIGIEVLCWELIAGRERSALAVELSAVGLRIERPYTGGPTRRDVPLELEVPGFDEVMWARADACFDHLVPATGPAGGPLGLIRRTGYRIVAAAARDLRMLHELVVETDRANRRSRGDFPVPSRPAEPGDSPLRASRRADFDLRDLRSPGGPAAGSSRSWRLGLPACYQRG